MPGDVLLDALVWVRDNLDGFELQDALAPDEIPLAELCLVCMCLNRSPSPVVRQWVKDTVDFIRPIYASDVFQERWLRTGSPFASRVLMFDALQACGAPESGASEHETIQELVAEANVTHAGKPAYRQMELRYVLDLGGFLHTAPSYGALCRQTILAAPELNLVYLTDAEAYCITHILFYLSDLGERPIDGVPGVPGVFVRRARRVVHGLLGIYLRGRHWDLVGELLIASHCLRSTASSWYRLGWRCLQQAQLPGGAVPGLAFDPTEAAGLTGPARRAYVFRHCYHSTLVAALARGICPPPPTT